MTAVGARASIATMVEGPSPIPRAPAAVAALLGVLPLAPLELALGLFARSVAARHPGLFERLGRAATGKRLAVQPTDLPFVLVLTPRPGGVELELRRTLPADRDGRIAGPLAALLGMLHGAVDGDALFFSRDLLVEGDTEAILALRNALDAAEIDLAAEALAPLGPFGRPLEPALALLARVTGLPLARTEASR